MYFTNVPTGCGTHGHRAVTQRAPAGQTRRGRQSGPASVLQRGSLARGHPRQTTHRTGRDGVLRRDLLVKPACPVVVITCVRYLGPPGPSPSQILGTFSGFSGDFLGRERERERPQGGSPRVREDPLGTPPSLSAKKVSENLEKVPRIWEVEGPGGPR